LIIYFFQLTNGPNVTPFIVTPRNDVGRDRVRSPHRLALDLVKLEVLAEAEVDHLQLRVGATIAEEEVLKL
jgi:hypothetical protein